MPTSLKISSFPHLWRRVIFWMWSVGSKVTSHHTSLTEPSQAQVSDFQQGYTPYFRVLLPPQKDVASGSAILFLTHFIKPS